jgi:dTDP-glucose pyrophosphorylase
MANPQLVAQLSIDPGRSLLEAIEQITRAEHKILLVAGADGRLLGIITDYDIRRAILNRVGSDTPCGEVVNRTPFVVRAEASEREIVDLMRRERILQLPILDNDGRAVDVRFIGEFMHLPGRSGGRTAVIMAGGLGMRLRPMTEHVPKPLLDVGGRPILFSLLDQMISENFTQIFVSLFYRSEQIIERVREVARYRECVQFVVEREPLGTAGALALLPSRPEHPFIVINADLLSEIPLGEMLEFHIRESNTISIALKNERIEVPYGVAEIENGRITQLREKPEIALQVNTGVYAVSPQALARVEPGRRLDMPQLVNQLLADKQRVGGFPVHELWLDIGTHEQYNLAQTKARNGANSAS